MSVLNRFICTAAKTAATLEELTGVQELPTEVKKTGAIQGRLIASMCAIFSSIPAIQNFSLLAWNMGNHPELLTVAQRGRMCRGIDYLDIHHISAAPGRKNLYCRYRAWILQEQLIAATAGNAPKLDLREITFMTSFFCRAVPSDAGGNGGQIAWATGTDRSVPRARYFAAAIWRKAGNESASASGCPRT